MTSVNTLLMFAAILIEMMTFRTPSGNGGRLLGFAESLDNMAELVVALTVLLGSADDVWDDDGDAVIVAERALDGEDKGDSTAVDAEAEGDGRSDIGLNDADGVLVGLHTKKWIEVVFI